MIALGISLGVLLLIFLILWTQVHVIFDYHESATVTVRILCFRLDGKKLFERFSHRDKGNQEKKPGESQSGKKKKRGDLLGFVDFLGHIGRVLGLAVKEHLSRTKIDLRELRVSIGTEDAAQTALLCGAAIQAANALCALLQHFSNFRCDNRNLSVSPDFCSEESRFSLHLVMSSRLVFILGVLIRTYIRFFERKEDNHARNPVKTSH